MTHKTHIYMYTIFLATVLLNFSLVQPIMAGQFEVNEATLENSAENLFDDCRRLFDAGNYWECSGNLILILDTFPQYSDIDKVVFLLGECLYETGMLEASHKILEFFESVHAESDLLPQVYAAMQRNRFEQQQYQQSLEMYEKLISIQPNQEIAQYGLYYAGLAHYYLENDDNAIAMLSQITESSPYYDTAMYNLGLSCLRNENIRTAIDIFEQICRLPVYTPQRQNLINETRLTLGYLYYEMEHYDQALQQFNKVTFEYNNYQDVLLSSGWAATQKHDYKQAIIYLTDFITRYPASQDLPQGLFLLGRCYLKLGYYDKALQSYDYLIDLLPPGSAIPDSMSGIHQIIASQQEEMERIKMDVLMLESKFINDLALGEDVPDYIRQQRDELAVQRRQLLERIHRERQTLNTLSSKMETILALAEVRDEQREWRAFAEYGKSRALYLSKQQQLAMP